jgi:hypothetical protein
VLPVVLPAVLPLLAALRVHKALLMALLALPALRLLPPPRAHAGQPPS